MSVGRWRAERADGAGDSPSGVKTGTGTGISSRSRSRSGSGSPSCSGSGRDDEPRDVDCFGGVGLKP
ncbi:hypothetical protein [Streptomyces neyagawaensis]|uniref:hypothetical protein n=1 Tax=Streptomyces neyagawaensis TaxID=42238 RepID=UPI00201CE387|nr:hypothetical protein [Streptomyces neyagawaensis]MCL6731639.1 hypothetical protein [Streptomyces neyagawaensis]MDE1683195.1 hypothetical protein [Streptomyces neyagawaensis]